jgi:hypothetical protein
VMDPEYLAGLVREAVGPPELRAEAARALVHRDCLRRHGLVWSRGLLAAAGLARTAGSRRLAATLAAMVISALVVGQCADRALQSLVAIGAEHGGGVNVGGTGVDGAGLGVGVVDGIGRSVGSNQPVLAPAESTRAAPGGIAGSLPRLTSSPPTYPVGIGAPDQSASADEPRTVECGSLVEGTVAAEEALSWIDTYQAVEFRVVGAKDTGKVTFLNSHDPYAGHFYVVVFASDYDRFAESPVHLFEGRCVVVQGTIEMYRGAPQIVLRDPSDVRVLDGGDR